MRRQNSTATTRKEPVNPKRKKKERDWESVYYFSRKQDSPKNAPLVKGLQASCEYKREFLERNVVFALKKEVLPQKKRNDSGVTIKEKGRNRSGKKRGRRKAHWTSRRGKVNAENARATLALGREAAVRAGGLHRQRRKDVRAGQGGARGGLYLQGVGLRVLKEKAMRHDGKSPGPRKRLDLLSTSGKGKPAGLGKKRESRQSRKKALSVLTGSTAE